jgi:hypothetical protein
MCDSLTDLLFLLWSFLPVTHTLLKIRDSDSRVWLFAAVLDKCHYSMNLSAGCQRVLLLSDEVFQTFGSRMWEGVFAKQVAKPSCQQRDACPSAHIEQRDSHPTDSR